MIENGAEIRPLEIGRKGPVNVSQILREMIKT